MIYSSGSFSVVAAREGQQISRIQGFYAQITQMLHMLRNAVAAIANCGVTVNLF